MPPPPAEAAGTPAAVHRAYRDLGVVGYVLYGVGAVSPFLRDALGLSDAQTGLHSSLVAIGLLGAGLAADRLDRRVGPSRSHAAAALVGALATLLLAWAPALAATLLAAAAVGAAVGVFVGHVNGLLGSDGGPEARTHLLRANVFGMVGPFVVPMIIAAGLATGIGWQLVFVPSLVLLALSFRDALRHGIPIAERAIATGRLPAAYWLAWALLVTVIGVEFGIVFWAATLVERRTGASIGDAALAAGGFFAGMLLGRIALSARVVGTLPPRLVMQVGLVVALVGTILVWAAGSPLMAAAGLVVAGLGVAAQYPLGVALTLAAGQAAPGAAAARLTLASGLAILASPLILGVAADAVGVAQAWALLPGACIAALALTLVVGRGGTEARSAP